MRFQTESIICIACKKYFTRALRKIRGRCLPLGVRGHKTLTCSTKCSKDATRMNQVIKYHKEKAKFNKILIS